MAACGVLVVIALASALVAVAAQTATLEARAHAAIEPTAVARMLTHTQGGVVWLVRGGLLVLLGLFVAARVEIRDRQDWRAARGQLALLGVLALGLVAGGGHAVAVEPGAALALGADILHLLASGVWIGGLPALALLLGLAARPSGADARPYAVLAARRFSGWALGLVIVLVASGLWSTIVQVGSVAGLLGTTHGRLLLAKLLGFVVMLAIAACNRRLLPALGGEAVSVGRPAMRRLAACVAAETILAMIVLAIVAIMTVTPPARHEQPTWPLHFRLSLDNLIAAPDFEIQVLIGSQVAVIGVVALLASIALRRLRLALLAGGVVVLAAGIAIAVPPLVSDAYPTTFQRPAVPYQAASIAEGAHLFAAHCAVCHGAAGRGDGPAAATLQPRPPDLRAHHVALHTAGDIFWWITHGRPPMPAFGDRLDADARWHLVNYLRGLAAADASKLLGAKVEPERPWLVAPDFTFNVGPEFSRSLKDYRGRKIVLLVLYTLPASRGRLDELASVYGLLTSLDVEILAVPTDAAADAIAQVGSTPPILFPVVTDGAAEIVTTYRLFRGAPHAEMLIDRQGYLRAIVTAAGDARRDIDLLLAEVQRLNAERIAPPPPAEHVH